MSKVIILLTIFLINQVYGQYQLLEYTQEGKSIEMVIELDTTKLSDFFINEGQARQVFLPVKEIFIGIPWNSSVEHIKSEVIKYSGRKISPSDIPGIENLNGASNPTQSGQIKILGYLFIDGIKTVHLRLTQYQIDNYRNILEAKEAKIELHLTVTLPSVREEPDLSKKFRTEDILINRKYCNGFSKPSDQGPGDSTSNWIDFTNEYIKITIGSTDIYRITYEHLQQLNLNPSEINPGGMNIYSYGKKIPVYIYGEADGLFDPGDFIEFVGERHLNPQYRQINSSVEPYNEYLGRYTDSTVYWLTWKDTIPCRISVTDAVLTGSYDTLNSYYSLLHMEKNIWFDFSSEDIIRREMPFFVDNKTWGWTSLGVGQRKFDFLINDFISGKTVEVFAKYQSFAASSDLSSHCTAIGLNDDTTGYDRRITNKYKQQVHHTVISSDSLRNGLNHFNFFSYPTGSSVNSVFFDWFEILYPRYLNIRDDSIAFGFSDNLVPGVKSISLDEVMSFDYSIWRIGTTQEKYSNYSITNNRLIITDTLEAPDKFIIKSAASITCPLLEPPRKFVNLCDTANRADYILITSGLFVTKALEYSEFIEAEYNLKSSVVNIQDIYNQFSFGNFNPEAIREFLNFAGQYWRKLAPEFVFLVGDCTYDYHRNKYHFQGAPFINNYVPSFGAPVSDNYFVIRDTTGACFQEMNIGRLPVNTVTEFEHYFNKHKEYLHQSYKLWNKKYIFFSGGPWDNPQQLEQLKSVNDSIISEIIIPPPLGGSAVHFYKTANPVTNFGPYSNDEVQNAIDSSAILISYLGHSGTQTWDNGIVDPAQLHNKFNFSPLITDFGCSTGKFAEPDIVSFSELFTAGLTGEASAYIGNSSLGFLSAAAVFPSIFYNILLTDSNHCISRALRYAKIKMMQSYGSSGVYKLFALTNTYLGDPVISLPLPALPDLTAAGCTPPLNTDDETDSAEMRVHYYNAGRACTDTFSVRVLDKLNSATCSDLQFVLPLPLYGDDLSFRIPVKNLAGRHTLSIMLDAADEIEETDETDNLVTGEFVVNSSAVFCTAGYSYENGAGGYVTLLNSSVCKEDSLIELEISPVSSFTGAMTTRVRNDSFFTRVPLEGLAGPGRIWVRAKLYGRDYYSFTKSFLAGDDHNYAAADSISFSGMELDNLTIRDDKLTVDRASALFSVISAGLNDGKTAVISKNGENYVPMGNVIGHHICVFKADTYDFVLYKKFDVFGGGQETIKDYYNFLDTLGSSYLVMIAVADEGVISADSLRNKIKEFGSTLIDSLAFRSSWALIGRRGIPPGTAPEQFHRAYTGRVQIDTAFNYLNPTGSFVTPLLGPAGKWESIKIQKNVPAGSGIGFNILGINDGHTDTLTLSGSDSSDISFLNYKFITVLGSFSTVEGAVPELTYLGVKYSSPAELGTNFRGMMFPDTLLPGDAGDISFLVTNAGDIAADSFRVIVEAAGETFRDTIYSGMIENLEPRDSQLITGRYTPGLRNGSFSFQISIDPGENVYEKYKNNNILNIPSFILKDTAAPEVKVFFDGTEIISGDYVSAAPEVRFDFYDALPVNASDTSLLKIFLDGRQIDYSTPSDTVFYTYGTSPSVSVTYKPVLSPGEHTIRLIAKDAYGNISDSADSFLKFYVADKLEVVNVYNYPNPFRDETSFTFIISELPHELKIYIYTVAGRLIKKIEPPLSSLHPGFNSVIWDGRDEEGDIIASGVYLYKVTVAKNGTAESAVQKLAIVR